MAENKSPRLNLTDAAAYLGIKPQSFRRAVHKGRVQGELVPHPTMPKVRRWEFTTEALDEYRESAGSVGTRPDGRNKYVCYLTQEELDRVTDLLQDMDEVCTPVRANPPKSE